LSVANREYRKFIKRFGYHVGDNESYIKYVVVPEFQKRGAVHYHLVIFNLPYIKAKIIARIWSHGYVKINAIDEVDNVGAYVCKYMTKDVLDGKEDKLAGQKCYFRSRDLIEPKEIRLLSDSPECKKLDELVSGMASSVAYDQEHDSEYYGTITYTQYRGENSCWKELFNTWQEMRAYQLR
jgi:hypothetical protein